MTNEKSYNWQGDAAEQPFYERINGDKVMGDKVGGDKVMRDRITHYNSQSLAQAV